MFYRNISNVLSYVIINGKDLKRDPNSTCLITLMAADVFAVSIAMPFGNPKFLSAST
jgi:hypothetical protein